MITKITSRCLYVLLISALITSCSDSSSGDGAAEMPNDDTTDGGMTDGEGTPAFSVDESNLNDVLNTVASISRADFVTDLLDVATGVLRGDFDSQLTAEPSEPPASFRVTEDNFSCDGGGTLTRRTIDQGDSSTQTADLESCLLDGVSYTGDIVAESGAVYVLSVTDFVASSTDAGETQLTGNYTDLGNRRIVGADYLEKDENDNVVLDIDYNGVESSTTLDQMEWQTLTPVNGIPALAIKSDILFERASEDEDFTVGTLNITTESGLSILINADNGDPASFFVLVNDGDATTSFSVNWNEDNRYFIAYGSQ